MNRLHQFGQRNRILMWLVLFFAVTNTAMLVFADTDDDPVTTRAEFCFTHSVSDEATTSIRQAGPRASQSAPVASAAWQDAHSKSVQRHSARASVAEVSSHVPLRC
jgi:hypothetical protein